MTGNSDNSEFRILNSEGNRKLKGNGGSKFQDRSSKKRRRRKNDRLFRVLVSDKKVSVMGNIVCFMRPCFIKITCFDFLETLLFETSVRRNVLF